MSTNGSIAFAGTLTLMSALSTTSTSSLARYSNPPAVAQDKSLGAHLEKLRSSKLPSPNRFVLGNEAADLDSVVSAIVYSALYGERNAQPIINIPRRNLQLRRDVILALRNANVDEESLSFVDDTNVPDIFLAPSSTIAEYTSFITIVDHNALAPHQVHLSASVCAIVDHHKDEHLFQSVSPRIVQPVGSCATLIAEIAEQLYVSALKNTTGGDGKADHQTINFLSPASAMLLLSAVLLDCHNMDKSIGKGTARDEVVIQKLKSIVGLDTKAETDELFKKLFAARIDISGMSALQLLQKDVKVVSVKGINVAICSVGVHPKDLAHRAAPAGLVETLDQYSSQTRVDAVIVMVGFEGEDADGFRRALLISRTKVGDFIADSLPKESDNVLDLAEGIPDLDLDELHHFLQLNIKASRKVVLPMVKSALEAWSQ